MFYVYIVLPSIPSQDPPIRSVAITSRKSLSPPVSLHALLTEYDHSSHSSIYE